MNDALLRMKDMRNLSAQIPLKEREVNKKQSFDINSPQFLEMLMGVTPDAISPEQALRITAVYSCIKVLAETVVTLPCSLQKINGSTRQVLEGDRLHKLVNTRPNDLMTAADFWAFQVVAICLQGNSYNYINRTSSGAFELMPIRYDEAAMQVDQPGNRVSYRFVVAGKPMVLKPEEVLHFKSPMSFDGYLGLSPLQYNAATLHSSAKSRDFNARTLANDATPRGILTTDNSLSDEAFANIAASWSAAHGGDNQGRVAVLEAGLSFQPISMSPADLKILDTQKYSRAEIAGMYRVPAHMIGDLERSTFNNIAHQTLDFYKNSIAPWLRMFEQRLAFSLLGDSSREFKFDVTEFIRGDFETEVASYTALIDRGVLSPNEVRERLMFNPRVGGDEYVSINQPVPQEPPNEPEA